MAPPTSVSSSSSARSTLEMRPLPALDMNSLIPKIQTDGITFAIKTLWESFSAQQELCSNLAAQLQQHKTDSEAAMTDMRDHLYGVINTLKDDLHKTKEENKEMNQALRDLLHASERETRQKLDDSTKDLNNRVNDVQQQLNHNAQVANTALERALDAKEKSELNAQKIVDVEDTLANDLNRLHRTLGLTKADARRACEGNTELDTMLATPPLAHILKLIGQKSAAGLSGDDLNALNEIRARVDRLDSRLGEMGHELRDSDKNLSSRIDKLESGVRNLEYNMNNNNNNNNNAAGASNGSELGGDQVDALTSALSKLRGEVAQLRSGLDHLTKDVAKKVDQDDFNKLADALASLAQRVASLEGTLNDTRGNVEEALRLARLALKNGGTNAQAPGIQEKSIRPRDGADAAALMMLRDQVDGLAGRIANLERELNDVDAKKSTHDELNRALQDVLKAMEQAISQLYDELRKQLSLSNSNANINIDDEPATSARFRCLSCNRKSGPLQSPYQERMSKPLLPPSDTIAANNSTSNTHGISPPRTSPMRGGPAVPGVRDGFDPRPMTGSRRKLQTYYDWLHTMKSPVQGRENNNNNNNSQAQNQNNVLANGLVGKKCTGDEQRTMMEQMMNHARVSYAENAPPRSESPNPATTVGIDGRHYVGVHNRNSGSVLAPQHLPNRPGTAQKR